jgi:hypothetical protein
MASYNQLAQLTSADTQNQLAQMQMQESRQLAPLRLQEQQSRAASTKLTYDQAVEAQTFIKGVMDKAAEHPEAPTDPFEAAMQMLQHPSNSQVREAGAHLLDATQKLMAFKNQMANEKAYAEDQRTGGAAPAGLPAVVARSTNDVGGSLTAPGTPAPVGFNTSARLIQPEGKSYADMNNTERIQFDVARIQNPQLGQPQAVYTLDGKEVPFREYVNANIANSTFKPDNALTAAMASEVAAAPAVNELAKKAVNPLQDAAELMKKIKDGDQKYARGGVAFAGWKNDRELLVKAFEQALKPGRNDGQRYLSLGAGAALDTETRELIARDRAPAAAAAPKIFSVRGIPHTLNDEGNLVPLTVEGGVSPAPAAAVAATPKIINIKGVPHTLNAQGNLVPVPVEGGALPAAAAVQPQAAPKITSIKGIPYTFDASTGKFVRVPIEGGALPVAGKGGTGKQATASKPKPPIGYRYDASGENLEPIPGGPASEKLQPKEIQTREAKYPQAITALKGFEAKTSKLERDIDELIANKDGLNEITGYIAGRTDLSAMTNAGRRALAKFNTITAKGGFSELQDMRNASPTGGALGNVSNQEGQQLVAAFGTLSRTQNADDLRSSLTTIKSDLQGSKQRVKEAFDETYAYRANRGAAAAPQGAGGFKYLGKE